VLGKKIKGARRAGGPAIAAHAGKRVPLRAKSSPGSLRSGVSATIRRKRYRSQWPRLFAQRRRYPAYSILCSTRAEFWSPDAYRAKVKTPLEYVVSARARQQCEHRQHAARSPNALRDMGMPRLRRGSAHGYKWDASDWVSTGRAWVNRMNSRSNLASQQAAVELPSHGLRKEGPLIAKIDDGSAPHGIAQNPTARLCPGPHA